MPHSDSSEELTRPTRCPACGSTDVTTTSKTIGSDTYWRCVPCGEIWNVGRRQGETPWPGNRRQW
jgi:transposase-like protein